MPNDYAVVLTKRSVNVDREEFKEEYDNDYGKLPIPNQIKGWNWGAFVFNIYWGIGNKTYLPLLCLIPIFNIIWIFVCGFKGNEWAWQSGNFNYQKDIDLFKQIQKTWNLAGIWAFIIQVVVIVLAIIFYTSVLVAFFSNVSYS